MRWLVRGFVGLCLIGALFLGFVFFASTKERQLPEVLVGFAEATVDVGHRAEPLPVFLWYPAQGDGAPELINQNALFYGFHARRNATALADPAPVVLLSHGSGGNAPGLGWIATRLAEAGMLVIATNHPGTTSRDSHPEETVKVWERPQDLSALLDLAERGLPHEIAADLSRVGVMGFSLGGFSALSLGGVTVTKDRFIGYCNAFPDKYDCGWMNAAGFDFQSIDGKRYGQSNKDARVDVVLAIDPALPRAIPEGGFDDLDAETLILSLGDEGTLPAALRWDEVVTQAPAITLRHVPDTYHFAFLSECSLMGKVAIGLAGDDNICSDKGTRPRADVHAEIAPVIVEFLADALTE